MAEPTVYIAIESGSAAVDGKPFTFVRNVTRVRAGHPALKQLGQFFRPVEDFVHYDVEQATSAPGEKRGGDTRAHAGSATGTGAAGTSPKDSPKPTK